MEKNTCLFHQKSEGTLHLLFAGIALRFERLKISSEIKGNFKLDGNVLKVAFSQKVRFIFQISKSPKKNIPKNYPDLEI